MMLVHTVSMFSGYMGPAGGRLKIPSLRDLLSQGKKKKVHFGPILAQFWPDFVRMGILVALSLSFKKAPTGLKIYFSS